jgi:hypothetical protein
MSSNWNGDRSCHEGKKVNPPKLNDREVLLIAYGALKAISIRSKEPENPVVNLVEDHLFPETKNQKNHPVGQSAGKTQGG